MAVFERKKSGKLTLDDTTALTCTIDAAEKSADHIEYSLRIQQGPVPENSWFLKKRYSDFANLDAQLKVGNVELPLPPKKVFGNFDRDFVAERQSGLQQYLNAVLSNHLLANSFHTKQFLSPDNYAVNIQEIALQHVSMIFRSEKRWDVVEPLPDIGTRLRKTYFIVRPVAEPKQRLLLSWVDFGPDKFVPDKELAAIFKVFPSFQHPYIHPYVFATSNENGGLIIQQFQERGTLRDLICKCKPKGHYLKKYCNPKIYLPMDLSCVKILGKMVLETLNYLHEKGLAYGNLHAGNLLFDGKKCEFLNLENWLLGVPSYYRPFFVQFKKIKTCELIDVYCFGHLLFEMYFGNQLGSATCDNFPPTCPAQIRSVLESILTSEACRNGIPSVTDLLSHPLFSDVVLPPSDKPVLKIPSKLKEAIRQSKEAMERRLHEEQKLFHQIKRISRAKEFHMSEEEKKKRRKSKKKALENGISDQTTPSKSTSEEKSSSSKAEKSSAAPAAPECAHGDEQAS